MPRVLTCQLRALPSVVVAALVFGVLGSACRGSGERPDTASDTAGARPNARSETAAAIAPPDTVSRDTARRTGALPPHAELRRWAYTLSASPEGDPTRCGLRRPSAPTDARTHVKVYFGCQPPDGPVLSAVPARSVPVPTDAEPMRVAVAALLRGPTSDEARAGYLSGFGESSARVGFTVHSLGDGLVAVNFDSSMRPPVVASNMAITQVVRTLAQFPGVQRVAILIDGRQLCSILGEC